MRTLRPLPDASTLIVPHARRASVNVRLGMESSGEDGPRERASQHHESALSELAQMLLENPWTHQALKMALEARERAQHAGKEALRGAGVPTATDVDRVERRMRGLSERLEAVEDQLDALAREVAALRQASTPPRG